MRLVWAVTALFLLLLNTVISAPTTDLALRDSSSIAAVLSYVGLEKRRGGGGGHGGGHSGGGHSGGGHSSSGGGSGSRSGSSSSRTGSSSTLGGTTRTGSGPRPRYGGGSYYAGGSPMPYAAGHRSPLGIVPFLLPLGALAFFPGLWMHPVYAYPFTHPYYYVNQTTNQNQSIPVTCLCEEYAECGCDNNQNSTYYESLFNGSMPTDTNTTRIALVNGTETLYINGTLPNGTTAASASGASVPAPVFLSTAGYTVMVATVAAMVCVL